MAEVFNMELRDGVDGDDDLSDEEFLSDVQHQVTGETNGGIFPIYEVKQSISIYKCYCYFTNIYDLV